MRHPLPAALCLALAAPVSAEPNTRLLQQVRTHLAQYGFSEVDAATLSTPMLARLHLALTSPGAFGTKQSKIKTILSTAQYRADQSG